MTIASFTNKLLQVAKRAATQILKFLKLGQRENCDPWPPRLAFSIWQNADEGKITALQAGI